MPKYTSLMDISTILDDYSKAIYRDIKQSAIEVAEKGAKTLRQTSPKRTGKYRRGWRVKTYEGVYDTTSIIYNATNWQLTHLLENGHITRNGRTKTTPKVHIYPVEQECIKEFEQDTIRAIEKESK